MTIVYLHIGTPKTGSSSLQFFLFNNRNKLGELGILYPKTGITKKGTAKRYAHHNLNWVLTKDTNKHYDPNAGNWEDLDQEINEQNMKPEKIILSAESFYDLLDPSNIPLIKEYLKKHETKIIVYLRNQYEYFRSYYGLIIRSGATCSFKQYILNHQHQGDYYRNLLPWCKIFGKENIIVIPYNKLDVIDDFLKATNIEINAEKNTDVFSSKRNANPSDKVINWMLFCNKIVFSNKITKNFGITLKEFYESERKKNESHLFSTISKIPNFLISNELMS